MVYEQWHIFCVFLLLGLLCGIFFDFFRALRKSFKTNNILTYLEDLIFLFIIGAIFLRCIIFFSSGVLRFYVFLAVIFGIIIYVLTIENVCAIIFKVILDFLKKFILCFIQIIKFPKKIIYKIIQKYKNIILNNKIKNNP